MNIRTFETAKGILDAVNSTNDLINLLENYSAKSDHSNIRLVNCASHTINTANIPKDLLTKIISLCQNYREGLLVEFENL